MTEQTSSPQQSEASLQGVSGGLQAGGGGCVGVGTGVAVGCPGAKVAVGAGATVGGGVTPGGSVGPRVGSGSPGRRVGVAAGGDVGSGGAQPSATTFVSEPVQVWLAKSIATFETRSTSPLQKFPTLSKLA